MSISRFRLPAAVTAVLAATAALLAPLPATAATPTIAFTLIQYDPAGTDTRSNAHLNQEYVLVRNNSTKPLTLAGWRIRDLSNHTFVFPRGYVLKAHTTAVIRTGRGTNTSVTLFWNQSNYIWNNTGDSARLQTPADKVIDRCTYGNVQGRARVAC
jgi:hypothetical protein